MGPEILKSFLTGCITAWYGNCSASDRKALQRVVSTVQYITGAKLHAIQDLYTRRCQRKALQIVKDPSHPSHRLFSQLLHGKRYRSAKSRTKRLQQFLPPSHKTPEQVTKLFALCASPNPSFTLLLLSVYLICIVTLTIHSCTYYLNWADQPVLPHIG